MSQRPEIADVVSLWREGRKADAAALCRAILDREPANEDAWFLAGCLAYQEGRHDDAIDGLQRSLALRADDWNRHRLLGDAYHACNRCEEAAACYERARSLAPGEFLPCHRLAAISMRAGDFETAEERLRETIARAPQYPCARVDLAMLLLRSGRCSEGWRQYEWRWKIDGRPLSRRRLPIPTWDGSPLRGRTLLLWAEQGFGDVIQFARFAAMVPKDGGRILVHAAQRLGSLLRSCTGVDGVLADGDWCDADLQFPLLSVPGALDVPLERLGEPVPYLLAPRHRPAVALVPRRPGVLNVGLVWASSRPKLGFIERDCPADALLTLADVSGVRLYGLQFGARAADVTESPAIRDLSAHLGDFHQTSAFVERMDLVITVDTSMAHLAGALGKPVWTLLSQNADWRWLESGATSPWYPSMTLYRQAKRGEWSDVIAAIRADLTALAQRPIARKPPSRRFTAPTRRRLVFKQYGEMRTGTNLLRALLVKNYPGTTVLMHVLGDKHSPPADFARLWEETRSAAEPAHEFVRRATFEVPSLTTTEKDPRQTAMTRQLAARLAAAWEGRELAFLVSIKEPYAWAASMARFCGWTLTADESLGQLESACRRFNERYTAWLELAAGGPCAFVHHEDLVGDVTAVLGELEGRFGLPCARAPEVPRGPLRPARWDYSPIHVGVRTFDADHYLRRRYLAELPPAHREVVTQTIDWDLLRRFDYAPLPWKGELRHAV